MKPGYTIVGKNEYAELKADFAVVECLLQEDAQWGAKIMELAGKPAWQVKLIRLLNWGWNKSRIIPETTERFIAVGAIGKRTFLTYQIDKLDNSSIQVTPIGFVPRHIKLWTAAILMLAFVVPLLLTPLVWKLHEVSNKRNSKLHLDAFCGYLKDCFINFHPRNA